MLNFQSAQQICRVLFIPLWLFHAAVVRYRFSLPAPSLLQNYQVCLLALLQIHSFILKLKCPAASKLDYSTLQRIPCHSIVATPLLVAFELLLCIYLEGINGESKAYCEFIQKTHSFLFVSVFSLAS